MEEIDIIEDMHELKIHVLVLTSLKHDGQCFVVLVPVSLVKSPLVKSYQSSYMDVEHNAKHQFWSVYEIIQSLERESVSQVINLQHLVLNHTL